MAEHTFTPGPWTVVEEDHDISVSGEGWFEDQHVNGWVIVGNLEDPSMAIAVIDTGYRNSWDDSRLDANAALASAAPVLLEANDDALDTCERLIADLREENAALHAQRIAVLEMTADKIRAAIAKARNHPKGSH